MISCGSRNHVDGYVDKNDIKLAYRICKMKKGNFVYIDFFSLMRPSISILETIPPHPVRIVIVSF